MLIKNILEKTLGGTERFQKNFLKIASASLAAQVISLICLPILTRLYTSSEFGIFTTYTMVQSISLAFVTGRVDWLIPNAKSDKDAQKLLALGLLCTAISIFLIAVIMLINTERIASILKMSSDHLALRLLPFGIISGATQLLLQSWYVLKGDLTYVGWAKFWQAALTVLISLLLGLFVIQGVNGLILGYIAGFIVAATILIWKARILSATFTFFKPSDFKSATKEHGHQILFSTALSLTNVGMTLSLIVLILTFYGNTILGWYGLVFRLATAPIGLITTGLVQSFWSDAAILVKTKPEQLKRFYIDSTKRLFVVAIPLTLIYLCGPLYIPFLFGKDEWSGAGVILMSVTPYLFGMVVFSSTTHLIVYKKAHWQLICDFTTLVLSIIVFATLALKGHSAAQAIFASSCIMLLGYILRFFVHLKANHLAQKALHKAI